MSQNLGDILYTVIKIKQSVFYRFPSVFQSLKDQIFTEYHFFYYQKSSFKPLDYNYILPLDILNPRGNILSSICFIFSWFSFLVKIVQIKEQV